MLCCTYLVDGDWRQNWRLAYYHLLILCETARSQARVNYSIRFVLGSSRTPHLRERLILMTEGQNWSFPILQTSKISYLGRQFMLSSSLHALVSQSALGQTPNAPIPALYVCTYHHCTDVVHPFPLIYTNSSHPTFACLALPRSYSGKGDKRDKYCSQDS